MNILELIKKDHDEAMTVIKRLEKMTEKATRSTWEITLGLVEDVLLHAKAEEKVLYSALKKKNEDLRDFTLEGEIEHKLLENTLKLLLKVRPGKDGRFKAALSVVKELLEHHGKEEEEKELFPKLRKHYEKDELKSLGEEFISMKEELRPKIHMKVKGPMPKAMMVSPESRQTLH